MVLESKYQIYLKEGGQNFELKIKAGIVHFDENIIVSGNIEITIKRTDNKNRERPDAHLRH